MIKAHEREPASVVSDEVARSDGRNNGRSFVFPAVFAGEKEVGVAARSDWPPQRQCRLAEGVIRQVIPTRGIGGREARECGFRGGRPPQLQQLAVELVA